MVGTIPRKVTKKSFNNQAFLLFFVGVGGFSLKL